jgi:hypothetical protein
MLRCMRQCQHYIYEAMLLLVPSRASDAMHCCMQFAVKYRLS